MGKVLFKLAIIACCVAVSLMLFRSYLPGIAEHPLAHIGTHAVPVWYLMVVGVFLAVGAKVK